MRPPRPSGKTVIRKYFNAKRYRHKTVPVVRTDRRRHLCSHRCLACALSRPESTIVGCGFGGMSARSGCGISKNLVLAAQRLDGVGLRFGLAQHADHSRDRILCNYNAHWIG